MKKAWWKYKVTFQRLFDFSKSLAFKEFHDLFHRWFAWEIAISSTSDIATFDKVKINFELS